jgi:hypothetical protein
MYKASQRRKNASDSFETEFVLASLQFIAAVNSLRIFNYVAQVQHSRKILRAFDLEQISGQSPSHAHDIHDAE